MNFRSFRISAVRASPEARASRKCDSNTAMPLSKWETFPRRSRLTWQFLMDAMNITANERLNVCGLSLLTPRLAILFRIKPNQLVLRQVKQLSVVIGMMLVVLRKVRGA